VSRKSSTRLTPIYSIALVLLALAGLAYIAAALPLESLSELRLRHLSWWVIPAIAFLHLIYLFVSAENWRRVIKALTEKRIVYWDAYLQMAAFGVSKYIPGKVWGFVARTGQLKRNGVSAQMSIMSSVVEQLLVLSGGGIIAVGAGIIAFPEYRFGIAALGAALIIGLVLISRNIPAVAKWLNRYRNDINLTQGAVERSPIQFLRLSLAYAIPWLISGMILGIIYFTFFDAMFSNELLAALVLANTIGFIVGFFAVFAPGGLGVREATTTAVLAPFLPVREVLLATIVLRTLIVAFDGINAVILLIGESRQAAKDLQ
jgi:uncharacterized membrane protein YbhN (UPF0104 family)